MTNLTRVKISRLFASGTFWIATVVSYLQFRGIPVENVYQIVSLYSIGIVALEYPTGVIGDYFGHKTSVFWGYLTVGITLFLMSLQGPIYYYYVVIILGAIGNSLISGSDIALLHKTSDDFKKEFGDINSKAIIVMVTSMTIATIVSKYYPPAPTILSSISYFIATFFVFKVDKTENFQDGQKANIFSKAKEGITTTFKDSRLLSTILFSSLVMMFSYSFKWFFNPLLENLNISEEFWGIIISCLTLLIGLGSKIFEKVKKISIELLIILLSTLSVLTGITNPAMISIFSLPLLFVVRGISEAKLKVLLNKFVKDRNRASINSLQSLFGRLFSSIYLLISGYLIKLDRGFLFLFTIASILFIISGLFVTISQKKEIKEN